MKQHQLFDQFCHTAANYVPKNHRSATYAELYAHLEDHYLALLADGQDEASAERSAVAAMGDAQEIGRQLRRAEWTPRGILHQLKALLSGSEWVVYYQGTDEKRYAQLCQTLKAAGIVFRTDEHDPLTRTMSAMSDFGSPMDNTTRRDGTNYGLMAARHFNAWNNAGSVSSSYRLLIRRRDIAPARRIERLA